VQAVTLRELRKVIKRTLGATDNGEKTEGPDDGPD